MEHEDERRESGQPGGGKGRRDTVERTGIWPASGPLPPGDAPVIGQGELGQGARGAEGYAESGSSEVQTSVTDPVCGTVVDPGRAERSVYKDRTYYFDSAECRARFERSPEQFVRDAA